ncbi:MAG TPA: hypothetical protein VGQ59_13590 [Cyclobacteriaceae bacterium]|jgi:hypothetical protein|nr:hypothetical protein [Cyclobacteriaceae bacterium]
MKPTNLFLLLLLAFSISTFAQTEKKSISLKNDKSITQVQVNASEENYKGKNALKVSGKGSDSEEQFVKINNLDFKDGIIDVELSGNPGEGASGQARGFVGIAFRINDDNSKFECFYLRPTNGRADDQLRRNHSTQYISFPDFPWHKLREQFPGKYESYVDLEPGEWTKVRIEVRGDKAKLFVHNQPQPVLIINDLKLGTDAHGSIGLWIGPGTDARFTNLSVTK